VKEVQRIKEIMNIQEDKKPRTAPMPTEGLIKLIQFTLNSGAGHHYSGGDVNFSQMSSNDEFVHEIGRNLKFIGVKDSYESQDYIFAFCKENSELLDSQDYDASKYMIPQMKKFEWDGLEKYNAKVVDSYNGTNQGYSVEFLQNALNDGEIEIWTGTRMSNDIADTWDTEVEILDIKEIPMNEQISNNLRKLQDLFG